MIARIKSAFGEARPSRMPLSASRRLHLKSYRSARSLMSRGFFVPFVTFCSNLFLFPLRPLRLCARNRSQKTAPSDAASTNQLRLLIGRIHNYYLHQDNKDNEEFCLISPFGEARRSSSSHRRHLESPVLATTAMSPASFVTFYSNPFLETGQTEMLAP
jgi:hypothetical protein